MLAHLKREEGMVTSTTDARHSKYGTICLFIKGGRERFTIFFKKLIYQACQSRVCTYAMKKMKGGNENQQRLAHPSHQRQPHCVPQVAGPQPTLLRRLQLTASSDLYLLSRSWSSSFSGFGPDLCFWQCQDFESATHGSWRPVKSKKNTHHFCWCQIFGNCKTIPKM